MARAKKYETITYTYFFQDGETAVIEAGQEGISEELIRFLRESDNEAHLQERYQRENEDYGFMNAQRDGTPFQIADPGADIFTALFQDDADDSAEENIRRAIGMLTEEQQDLVWEAYGMMRGDTEIAEQQNVSRQAIANRRKKMLHRVEKILQKP